MNKLLSLLLLALLSGLFSAGCKQDPYLVITQAGHTSLDSGIDGGQSTEGGLPRINDAKGEACVPASTGEICDGQDNDCNGIIDDVPAAKLANDLSNCGGCGTVCSYVNGFAKCEDGKCALDRCAPGYWDQDKNWTNGCEYQCLLTNGGQEACPAESPGCACDNLDNDCNGLIDETFDKKTDINNCGTCGTKCYFNHATPLCQDGKCAMGDCESNYKDINKNTADGCEYACPVSPQIAEVCNGKDDNCNGEIDEGSPGSGLACQTGNYGECALGTTLCVGSKISCIQNKSPIAESCDGKDNDCDNQIDEDFNLQNDTMNCGSCGKICSFTNGIPVCNKGICQLAYCKNGYRDLNNNPADGCEQTCNVWPIATEICDGKDNDCDGNIDEDFNLQTDAEHCGNCSTSCHYAHATGQCVSGKCQMGACEANYYNIANGSSDGCEYHCFKSNNGVEICDNADNDCDGTIDNNFNLQSDLNNCGSCGHKCIFSNAPATCSAGKCVMGACADGYKDLDKLTETGCEYQCPVWPVAASDPCDGIDNDCDGTTDEDFVSTTCGTDTGECVAGKYACIGGQAICQGSTGAKIETCNLKDDDCNGTIDDGFNTLTDPRYCNNCQGCSLPHAIAKCTAGTCGILVCETGWVDQNATVSDGCEYNCTPTGPEICDGIDNDCDTKVDQDDSNFVALTGNPCFTSGACNGATATCQGTNGWVCNYGANVQLRACATKADCNNLVSCTGGYCPGIIATEETLCDAIDNDCDGQADESFSDKGKVCYEAGKQGICQRSGTYICNTAKTGLDCNLSGSAVTAIDELCNGLDDDCDGLIDEESDDVKKGVVDSMVHIQRTYNSVNYDFYIYTYEASRPDATATASGSKTTRACSTINKIPWANVTYTDALAACQASGKTLCTATQWFLACSGANASNATCTATGDGCLYPYSETYDGAKCNGKDFNPSADSVVATGSVSACKSYDNVYDMSGNLREWTNDPQPVSSPQGHTVRGGSYDTVAGGLRCDFTFIVMPDSFYYPNLGFRCCSNSAP